MRVEVIFFDAAGTLIHAEPSVAEVYARALCQAGIRADAEAVRREFERAWGRMRREQPPSQPAYGGTEAEAMDWWRRVVRESFRPFGVPEDFESLFLGLWEHFASAEAWRLYDDVLPTLEVLERRGTGIGLMSNWDVRLFRLLDGLGLRRRLRWVVVSCEVGVEKPHAAIFARALTECGRPPEAVLHVGDSYEEDVVGARRAGMHAVWLRRSEARGPVPAGVTVIATLAELADLIEQPRPLPLPGQR